MGLHKKWSCTHNYTPQPTNPNPDPALFRVLREIIVGDYKILVVLYIGCTTFEGVKVVVFNKDYKIEKWLDPHFRDSFDSPIMRFPGSEAGINLAIQVCKLLSENK